jgi:hypothetical protein
MKKQPTKEEESINRKRLIEIEKDRLDLTLESMGLEFEYEDGIDDGGMY